MESGSVVLVALVVGALVGLTGVGGGAVMTPALIFIFQVPPVVAIATDLLFATLTKVVASAVHFRGNAVDWRVARLVWSGSIPGTVVGVGLVVVVGSEFGVGLSLLLAGVLLLTSFSMLRSQGGLQARVWSDHKTRLGGAFIGFSVATTSIGAGALGMALLRARVGDSDPRKLVGTDIVHAVPVALIAGASYGFFGFIDFDLLFQLLLGSIPGVIIGSLLAGRINTMVLRRILGLVLALAAVGVLVKIV